MAKVLKLIIAFFSPLFCNSQTYLLNAPCPYYTVQMGGDMFTYCGEATGNEINIPGYPCGNFDMYVTVEFTTDGAPYPIEVSSNANYTEFPNSPINIQQVRIFDTCDGELLASTNGGSCAFGAYCGETPSQQYTAWFCLPEGTYIAYIGYMNVTDLPFNYYYDQTGCITYTFGFPTFLNMENGPENTEQQAPHKPKPRYQKVVRAGNLYPVIIDNHRKTVRDYRGRLLSH